eukprot:Lithocolla_globosa_v1_NODE_540_length_3787_cov_70.867631.p3 type:complete len:215 gc:universal NODE_540_length_3787_cov_70.867631:1539-2183(+)
MESLVKWGVYPPGTLCRLCENGKETILHMLRDCPVLQDTRNSWWRKLEESLMSTKFLSALQCDFILRAFKENAQTSLGSRGLITKRAKKSLQVIENVEKREKIHSLMVDWILKSIAAVTKQRPSITLLVIFTRCSGSTWWSLYELRLIEARDLKKLLSAIGGNLINPPIGLANLNALKMAGKVFLGVSNATLKELHPGCVGSSVFVNTPLKWSL